LAVYSVSGRLVRRLEARSGPRPFSLADFSTAATASGSTRDLIDAIDDHSEKLTGDRRALHAKAYSIP
jgi:hypothetical protein